MARIFERGMFEVRSRGTTIRVFRADITTIDCDAIVNAANSYLTMGGGVAGVIRRLGGTVVEEEAVKHAPLPIGEAVATMAGRLKVKHVIHAPTMGTPGPTSAENVYKATAAALRCAEELGLSSLAIPGLGTGVGGVEAGDAAKSIISAIGDFLKKGSRLETLYLVDLNEEVVEAFRSALKSAKARLT